MALIDLSKELARLTIPSVTPVAPSSSSGSSRKPSDNSYTDEHSETALTDQVIRLMHDTNAEVKNMSVTW
jgi:hypothetical protein